MIKIIVVGNKTKFDSDIKYYVERLNKPFNVEFKYLKNSELENDASRNFESDLIFKEINSSDFIILLDERGKQIDNYELVDKITNNKNVVFIIGGSYGVNEKLRMRANFMLSLSSLIFNYELCRLILVEQIYRSQMIFLNHPYHKK